MRRRYPREGTSLTASSGSLLVASAASHNRSAAQHDDPDADQDSETDERVDVRRPSAQVRDEPERRQGRQEQEHKGPAHGRHQATRYPYRAFFASSANRTTRALSRRSLASGGSTAGLAQVASGGIGARRRPQQLWARASHVALPGSSAAA